MRKVKKIVAIIMAITLIISSMTVYAEMAETTDSSIEVADENVPANISISRVDKTLTIIWNAVEDAVSYNVYRATGMYSTYEKVGYTTECSYTETVTDSVYNYYYKVTAVDSGNVESALSKAVAMDIELFGDSVNIFSPTDDVNQINSVIKSISDVQMPANVSEFTDNRYALMFKPGNYNINKINVGFYTQVLGLGATPYDVTIPNINVDSAANGNVLINFWRGIENLSVDTGSPETEVKWGASQAAPIRRLYVNGKLHLDDIGLPASGGFLADTYVTGQTGSWSQQQFMIRNTHMTNGWYDGVWNMLFVGCHNAPESIKNWDSTTSGSYTTVEKTEKIEEKPFLYIDENGEYAVFVPGTRADATGVSWSENSMGVGTSVSIDDFYIAKADVDTAETLNAALDEGKHLIFTPGIYRVTEPLNIENENTVVLGLGLATIICDNTDTAFKVADKGGITIAGLIIEAGANESKTLIEIGDEKNDTEHSGNPILLSDIFCRVGGTRVGKTEACVEINSNDVIGDHFWIWRADHGAGANWTESTAKNGVVVNGDDVTIYGLFVEHFQEYQTLWNGENGKTFFYQSELPYDVPYQTDWMSNDGTVNGYASYKVDDNVENHQAIALGIYEVFIYTQEYIKLDQAMEVSDGTKVTNACVVSLGNVNGEISSIVNGQGSAVGSHGVSQQGLKVGVESFPIIKENVAPVSTNKKGICSWYYAAENEAQRNVEILKNAGATWTYNWGDTQAAAEEAKAAGMEYVPMTWGAGSVNATEIEKLKSGKEAGLYENLLTFNEPDLKGQANMSVDQAIALWSQLEATGLRLGSPVGAAVESAWVDEFMTKAKEKGYRVDFLTIHVYQDFTHPGSVESFRQALERLYNKYHLPIWVTELGCIDVEPLWWGYTRYGELTHEASATYITEVVEMLESLDYVERYAWFVDSSSDVPGTAYTRLFDTDTGELTVEGEAFKMAGPVEDDGEVESTTPSKPETTTPSLDNDETTTAGNNEQTSKEEVTTAGSSVEKPTPSTNVKRPSRAKVKKLKLVKKKSLVIKLKKVKTAVGYKVQISTTKKFKKKSRITKITTKRKLKVKNIKKPKKLKKVKKYYFVRVKAYKIVNGKKLYSKKWSKIKKIKVKK